MRKMKFVRDLKVLTNLSLGDVADTTGVAVFVNEIIRAGVILLVSITILIVIGKVARRKGDKERPGAHPGRYLSWLVPVPNTPLWHVAA